MNQDTPQTTLKPSLSIVMIVKDEEHNLSTSLSALIDGNGELWADELIVLDSGSTDNSRQLVEQYGGKWFVNEDWQGFGKQRQLAQSYANSDWILALDADEEITPELKQSILATIAQNSANVIYGVRCLDLVFGHAIDNPNWRIKGHWRLYPNTFKFDDNLVHESVILNDASTKVLSGFIHHNTAPSPLFWLDKRLQYALSWAKDKHIKDKKIHISKVILNPIWAFIKQYFIDGRFLQGSYGFIYALFFSQYTFNKYAILYDMNHQKYTYEQNYIPHKYSWKNLPSLPDKKQDNSLSLSVVLIVKNEEKHLTTTLYNIYDIADEIIILDSGSTDNTRNIAAHFNAQWYVNTDWEGFGKQRQLAQSYASGDYILMLDADEQLDDELRKSIINKLNQPIEIEKVYAIRYKNLFCGRIQHKYVWYNDSIVRFYANKTFKYHNYEVHESVNYRNAKRRTFNGYMIHYTNDNLYHFLWKNVRYSHDWADEKFTKSSKKVSLLSIPFRLVHAFIREYVFRGEFLNGAYGFFRSVAASGYNLDKYAMLWEKRQAKKNSNKKNL